MSRADVQRLIDALPRGLSETPEARRWLWGLLSPVSIVRQYLDQRIDRIEWLLDPDLVPGEQILFLAALFGLNMRLTAPDGQVHADADVARWMADAGFGQVDTRPFPPPMPHRLVTGVKP